MKRKRSAGLTVLLATDGSRQAHAALAASRVLLTRPLNARYQQRVAWSAIAGPT
jgi:hypothetical protein